MRLNWFRMYQDARNDAKLRTLSDSQFRVWFNLLCLSSEQIERGLIPDYDLDLLSIEVAGGDDDLLRGTIRQLVRLRIVSDDGCDLSFIHFLERQYDKPSDQPAAVRQRVTKHRETSNKEGVTPSNAMKRDETHIQYNTIQEVQEVQEDSADATTFAQFFAAFWEPYPYKVGKKQAELVARSIEPAQWPLVLKAIPNYAQSSDVLDGYPKRPENFIIDETWRDYQDGPVVKKRGNGHAPPRKTDHELRTENAVQSINADFKEAEELRAKRKGAFNGDNEQIRRIGAPREADNHSGTMEIGPHGTRPRSAG